MDSVAWANRGSFDESGLQQFAIVPNAPYLSAKVPDNISDDDAATLPTGINTAHVGLYDETGFGFPSPFTSAGASFGNGKPILVLGGSTIIGLAGKSHINVHLSLSCSISPAFWFLSNPHYSSQKA